MLAVEKMKLPPMGAVSQQRLNGTKLCSGHGNRAYANPKSARPQVPEYSEL